MTTDSVRSAQDYVKVIYAHTEWQSEPITPSQLAARLGLAPSTVTEAVKKLAASGLVTHVPYGAVTLTAEGRALALRMVRRHRLIETLLVEQYGYTWDEVHEEAEVLEHAVSDRLLGLIATQLGDPTRDPHGDPIPSADGSVAMPDSVLLADAETGVLGRVARISDRDPDLLRWLHEHGVYLDVSVEVLERRPFGGALVVSVGGASLDVGSDAATAIWVTPSL